ncbi:MAG: TonB-dependent receptor [Chitinophagaceae bacterium]
MAVHLRKCIFLLILFSKLATAQTSDTLTVNEDTTFNVIVSGFSTQTRWLQTAAAISTKSQAQLQPFCYINQLTPVLNSIAGVCAEERSPGSIRIAIRGSSLRSPFGVRNVKMYWAHLPLTDAGGNTYANLLHLQQVQQIEVIKGASGSLYGSGTGGVIVLQPKALPANQPIQIMATAGNLSLQQYTLQAGTQVGNKSLHLVSSFLRSNGYRVQTAQQRADILLHGQINTQSTKYTYLLAHTNYHYETPGGLTLQQVMANPQQARPAAGNLPSAQTQQTGVKNSTTYMGVQAVTQLQPWLEQVVALAVSNTNFQNPFITNYEKRNENNIQLRYMLTAKRQWQQLSIQGHIGTEQQWQKSNINNYQNNSGTAGAPQFEDAVRTLQQSVFTQVQAQYRPWQFVMAVSSNITRYQYQRNFPNIIPTTNYRLASVIAPRWSVLYQLARQHTIYATAAKGFAPPTLAEFRASDNNFNTALQAEQGWMYELGYKTTLWQQLKASVAAYQFAVNNGIVRQLNNNGAEYFINSNQLLQPGIEAEIEGNIAYKSGIIRYWCTAAYQPYTFKQYRIGSNIFDGNTITGTPLHLVTIGGIIPYGKYELLTQYRYVSKQYLNDANTVAAPANHQLLCQLQYTFTVRTTLQQLAIYLIHGIGQPFVLGYDINAAGNRFYNPAAPWQYSIHWRMLLQR